MQKLTLKKIAKELDVSISTVSKALKDSNEISAETREKIKAFASFYNYKPNNIALSLKNRKTMTIGVIIPQIVHYFFTTVISGIENVANKKGYNVIIGLSNDSFEKEVSNMKTLSNGSIDGFILSVANETQLLKNYEHLRETINQNTPVVMFDRVIPEINCDKVIVDDEEAAKKSVSKLLSLGCKKIAIITTKDYVSVGKLRTKGYLKALKENNVNVNSDLILKLEDTLDNDSNLKLLETKISKFLKSNFEIDGIFCVNEIYALTAIKAARKLNKKIPQDIKVIGFTDGVLSRFSTPSLTTISQHGRLIGEKSANLLINRLEGKVSKNSYQTIIIETELIERESTLIC